MSNRTLSAATERLAPAEGDALARSPAKPPADLIDYFTAALWTAPLLAMAPALWIPPLTVTMLMAAGHD